MAPTPKQKQLRPDGIAAKAVVDGRVKVKYVAGLDTASDRWHLYISNGDSRVCHAKGDPDERRHRLYEVARTAFHAVLPHGTLLVCEEPLALKNGKTTRLLGLAAGAIWAAHLECPIFWAWADVSAWKKAVIGNGNADKAMIKSWVQLNMGLKFDEGEEDLYDAAALCRYGQQAVGLI